MELTQLNLVLDLLLKILGVVVLAGILIFVLFVTSLIIKIRLQLLAAKQAAARMSSVVRSGVLAESVVQLAKVGIEEKVLTFLIDKIRGFNK